MCSSLGQWLKSIFPVLFTGRLIALNYKHSVKTSFRPRLLVRGQQLIGDRHVVGQLVDNQRPPDVAVHAVPARCVALVLHRRHAHVVQARRVQQTQVERLRATVEIIFLVHKNPATLIKQNAQKFVVTC